MRPVLEVADIFRRHGDAFRAAQGSRLSAGSSAASWARSRRAAPPRSAGMSSSATTAARPRRLQFLPQPALPQVPGAGARQWLAERPRRTSAGSLFPRRLHRAGPGRRDRLPEQGGRLRHPVPGRRRDGPHHRRRSAPSRRRDRHHRGPAYLGADPDPSPARPLHRARAAASRSMARWIACRPGFFLPVHVLSRLFRRLFLERLLDAFEAGRLSFFGDLAALAEPAAFARHLAPLRRIACRVGGDDRGDCSPDGRASESTRANRRPGRRPDLWPSRGVWERRDGGRGH